MIESMAAGTRDRPSQRLCAEIIVDGVTEFVCDDVDEIQCRRRPTTRSILTIAVGRIFDIRAMCAYQRVYSPSSAPRSLPAPPSDRMAPMRRRARLSQSHTHQNLLPPSVRT